jgi:hypothetical protein
MNPMGSSKRVYGGEPPPSQTALVVVHWEGVEEKWKVNACEGEANRTINASRVNKKSNGGRRITGGRCVCVAGSK